MNNSFFSTTYNRTLGTLALLALVVALVSYAYYTLRQADNLYSGPTTISVSGEGEVTAIPDVSQFSFSVIAKGVDAKTAQNDSATKVNDILKYLKENGVTSEADIKTESYTLNPQYRYEQKPCQFGQFCPPGEQIADGFEAAQTISVKVRGEVKPGDLISGVGERGATNVSGLSFTVDDEDALKAEARALAIADAKEKSKELAKELGVRVVRMTSYFEEGNTAYPIAYSVGGEMMKSDAPLVAPELPRGENMTTSRVTITYQVK